MGDIIRWSRLLLHRGVGAGGRGFLFLLGSGARVLMTWIMTFGDFQRVEVWYVPGLRRSTQNILSVKPTVHISCFWVQRSDAYIFQFLTKL